jgi:hypothetical protein
MGAVIEYSNRMALSKGGAEIQNNVTISREILANQSKAE